MSIQESFPRLGLGTVQFGLPYGISNVLGQVTSDSIATILDRAAQANFSTLDTAANYGSAEEILGNASALTTPFRIVTKTIGLKSGLDAVLKRARQSVLTLGSKPVDLLLVHSAGDLAGEDGRALWRGLLGLRDEGLYKGIGISAYVADDPAQLARDFCPDAMQVPFSLLDQRLLRNGALAAVKDQGVEIHARSLFLQGLLFMEDGRLPPKLRHAASHLAAVRRYVADAGSTPLAAALAFALSTPQIDVALVGVSSPSELDEIIAAAAPPIPAVDWAACALDDETVLTPSLW